MSRIILHIPHSGTKIPFYDGYLLPKKDLECEILKLTDWHTDDLFDIEGATRVVAPFSRIFCDVERFPDDKDEIMAQYGMGMVYTKTDAGKKLREASPELKQKIFEDYYKPHHLKLETAVEDRLKLDGGCLVVDCHSFSDKPFKRDLVKGVRPDICIGADDFHTPGDLVDFSLDYFKSRGLACEINSPYSGSIVPLRYYKKEKRVQSIMIEINRKLYLKEGTKEKSTDYNKIKQIIKKYINNWLHMG